MAWPPSDIGTGNTDAGTDSPQAARADILGLMQGFNLLRNHFSAFMRGLAEAVDAPAARTALGASTVGSNVFTAADGPAARTALGASAVGSNVFTAADVATARSAIGAADAAATVNLTGAQTVGDLKTFSGGHLSSSNSQAIGYATGAGGRVTQATNTATAVTINRPVGSITTANTPNIGAGASYAFVVNNSTVAAWDIVVLNAFATGWRVDAFNVNPGSFYIRVTNTESFSLPPAVEISFAVIKGASA